MKNESIVLEFLETDKPSAERVTRLIISMFSRMPRGARLKQNEEITSALEYLKTLKAPALK